MHPLSLALQCLLAIHRGGEHARISLVIPLGRYPKQFPHGHLCCSALLDGQPAGVWSIPCRGIVRALVRHGVIEVVAEGAEPSVNRGPQRENFEAVFGGLRLRKEH